MSAPPSTGATRFDKLPAKANNGDFDNLPHKLTGLILKPMQLSDFFNAGNGLTDTIKIVLFKMLPRGAQIEKVRAEINRGVLKKYGKMTKLEIDKDAKAINVDLELKGEKEGIRITLSNYHLTRESDKNLLFEPGKIEASREWLDALLKTLVKMSLIPERMEIKNPLHQAVVRSIL